MGGWLESVVDAIYVMGALAEAPVVASSREDAQFEEGVVVRLLKMRTSCYCIEDGRLYYRRLLAQRVVVGQNQSNYTTGDTDDDGMSFNVLVM